MIAHEAALVNVSVDSVDSSLTSVLPDDVVSVIGKLGLIVGVLSHHQLVIIHLAQQVIVVEVPAGVEQGLLVVGFLHQQQKLHQGVAKLVGAHRFRLLLDVDHRDEILVTGTALAHEVAQLELLGHVGMIEMIRTDLQPIAMGQFDVPLVGLVLCLLSFGGFEIYVGHVAVVSKRLPPHIALVMTHVKTMDVVAGVLALNPIRLGMTIHSREYSD